MAVADDLRGDRVGLEHRTDHAGRPRSNRRHPVEQVGGVVRAELEGLVKSANEKWNKTRIATLMLNNDLSQMNFRFLEGVQGALHLDLTHNGKAPAAEAMYLKTNQFHTQQFAYLLKRLKDIDEGGQSLLDSSMLLMCSNLFDGDTHSAEQMPMVLAGRGAGTLKPGRVLDYMDKGDDNRRACSLYLSLMDRMNVKLDRFGDSDKRLADL